MIPVASGLSNLVSDTDLLLVDVWGVIHNGVVAHGAAIDALKRFRARGGFVALISNAPRVADFVIPFLDRIGVPRDAYDALVTSGDIARDLIARGAWPTLAFIGPDKDRPLFAGLAMREAPVAEAAMVLCAGFAHDETETPENYDGRLRECRARGLTMICANPDLMVERGRRLIPCAGILAERYADMGGDVIWTGKPDKRIYEAALDIATLTRGHVIERARILAIGDAPRTDIAGARAFGVRSLMIADGIHAQELLDAGRGLDESMIRAFFADVDIRPDAIMAKLVWRSGAVPDWFDASPIGL